MNTSFPFAVWLSWRELIGRRPVFAINVLIIAVLISLPVSLDLMGKTRGRSVEQRIDYIGPSLSLVPEGTTSFELTTGKMAGKTLPQETVAALRTDFAGLIRSAEPRLLVPLEIHGRTITAIGMDFTNVYSYPFTLYSPTASEVLIGPVASKKLAKTTGDSISIGPREFTIAAITEETAAIEDASLIFPMPALQEITGQEGRINEIRLYTTSPESLSELTKALKTTEYSHMNVVDSYRGDVVEKDLENTLSIYQQVVFAVAFLLIALCIMIGTYINLEGRRAEISTIYTLGSRQSIILALLCLRTVWITFLGTIVGHLLAILVVKFSEPQASLVSLWSSQSLGLITAATITLGLLVTFPFFIHSLFLRDLLADL